MKGQLFLTVKVRNDPGPALPDTGLGIGVDDVEVGFNDDVAVTARATALRLREQTFILVEEMVVSLRAVLFRLDPRRLVVGVRSTATTEADAQIAKSRSKPGTFWDGTRESES